MESKLHAWLYGLLYPAFLGSVFVTAFASGLPSLAEPEAPWFWALALYFLIQFGEGVENRATYTRLDFAADFIELICMGVGFYYLGALTAGAPGCWGIPALGAVVVALAIPPAKRAIRGLWLKSDSTRSPVSVLSVLSLLAIIVVVLSLCFPWTWAGFFVLLAVYLGLVVCSDYRRAIDQKWFDKPVAPEDQARSDPSEDPNVTPISSDDTGPKKTVATGDDPPRENKPE